MNKHDSYQDTGIEWIGRIPSEWDLIRGKYLFLSTKEINKNLQCKNLLSLTYDGVLNKDYESSEGLRPENYNTYQIFKKNDLVFKMIDLKNVKTSRVGIVHEDGIMSSAYIRQEPIKEKIDSKFAYWFYYDLYKKEIYNSIGSGVRSTLSSSDLLEIELPTPPLEEQKLISRYLDKKSEQIDMLIDKIQKKIELLKEQRTSLIHQCVTKGLDPNVEMKNTNIKWIGKIPKNWNTIPNKYIFLEYFGGSWGDDPKDDQKENLVRVIRVTEFNMKTLCISSNIPTIRSLKLKKNSKKYIKKNDLILEKSGGGEKTPVGRVVLIDKDLPYPTVNSNFTNICRPNPNIVCPKFVVYSFWSKYKNGQTLRNIKQTTGIQNLDLLGFMSEIFILPEIEEQIKISKYLDNKIYNINNMIKKLDSKISLLKEYRKSFISSAVTGVIRVSEELI